MGHVQLSNISYSQITNDVTIGQIDVDHGITHKYGDTYWDMEEEITNDIIFHSGSSLNIQPSTIVNINPDKDWIEIVVEDGAEINAQGTSQCPIIFNSVNATSNDDWQGLKIRNNAAFNLSEMHIKNAETGLLIETTQDITLNALSIENCKNSFIFNNASVIHFHNSNFINSTMNRNGSSSLNFTNCTFDAFLIDLSFDGQNTIFQESNFINGSTINIQDYSSPAIKNNLFTQKSRITLGTGSNPLIQNNCFIGDINQKTENAITIGAYDAYDGCNPKIFNNTLAFYQFGIATWNSDANEIPHLKNNIFYQNALTSSVNFTLAGNGTVAYNAFHNVSNLGAPPHNVNGNIRLDPLFVDPINNDFDLNYGSPCIDTGNPNDDSSNEPLPSTKINMGYHGNTSLATENADAVYEGTINQNTNWDGNILIKNNLTVASGITLTINEGAKVYFRDNVALEVHGSLDANGSSNDKVLFTTVNPTPVHSDWYGIKIYNNANIDYCTVEFADRGISFYNQASGTVSNSTFHNNNYGIYISQAVPTIENCAVHDNNRGIYLYRTNDVQGYRTQIMNNEIYNNNYEGIDLYKSSPDIRNNTIYNQQYGIFGFMNASPWLGNLSYRGYNNIYDNTISNLWFEINCDPDLGQESCTTHGGYNQITGNAYHVWAETDCYVMAQINYWDPYADEKFSAHDGSTINRSYPLGSPLFGGMMAAASPEESLFDAAFNNDAGALSSTTDSDMMHYYKADWPILNKLIFARNLIYFGDKEDAQSICKSVIEENPDSTLSFFALDILWEACRYGQAKDGSGLESFENYLLELSAEKEKKVLYGYSELLSGAYDHEDAVATTDNVYNKYESTFLQEAALLQKFMYYYHELNDIKMAEQIANQLAAEFPSSTAAGKVKTYLDSSSGDLTKNVRNDALSIPFNGAVPSEFSVSANYPNPFNPSTTIAFTIPEASSINAVIYNMLGQKVKTFSPVNKAAGRHTLIWDSRNDGGADVPSGLYILNFYAVPLNNDRSVFTKTIKMLLLR